MSQSTKDAASLASGIRIDSIQCLVSPDASIFNSDFEATVWLREHLPVFLEAMEVVRLLEPVLERISQPGERWPALAARSVIKKHRQAYIQYRLEILGKNAHERMSACSPDLVGAFGGAEIDFMTPEEREERHQLMLELPSFAEERLAAIDRIRQRVSERRRGKAIALVAEATEVRRAPCKVGAFPAGANPARPLSLRPEAIGAVMEVTKWLKPSV